ncbi:hemolysin XhlA family protein [bacterium]|nr:hemolysin XhlA family protein [bacterium]MBU1598615.1 hemolysin XhlA family protein [bacterium]
MKKLSFATIVMVFVFVGEGFCRDDVTNRQILEKLNSLEVRIVRIEEGQKNLEIRIVRLETKVEEGQKSLQKQIDSLQSLVMGGFGVMLAGIFALIGFVLWDRRTALAPAVKKVEALEKREENLERALREFAQKEPRLTEALKATGLL